MSGSDLLRASTHKQSSHGKNEFVSVTVRKEDPKEKAGIRLEAEATGRVRVVNIAKNGLFANSDVEIGDIVLSINGKRLQKGEGPEELIEVIARAKSKVTVVVKKTNVKQTVPEVTPRDPSKLRDNNITQTDTFYMGQSRHNEDGSLAFITSKQTEAPKKKTKSVTISANKEDQKGSDIDETGGLTLVVQNKMLFVGDMKKDSIFSSTALAVGDRVLSINDCNFRGYADANLASRMVLKANNAVTIVVEKGVEGFTPISGTGVVLPKGSNSKPKRSSKTGSRLSGKSGHSRSVATDLSSDLDSTDSISGESYEEDEFGEEELELGALTNKSKYREVVIAAPKEFSTQEVGVLFEQRKNKQLLVERIQPGSIFLNTSLEVGDIVLEVNGVDYRHKPDKNHAWKTCKMTKETVTMLVLKRDASYAQQEFDLDSSSTNLEWQ